MSLEDLPRYPFEQEVEREKLLGVLRPPAHVPPPTRRQKLRTWIPMVLAGGLILFASVIGLGLVYLLVSKKLTSQQSGPIAGVAVFLVLPAAAIAAAIYQRRR